MRGTGPRHRRYPQRGAARLCDPFAAAGIAALTYDYRHLGTSEGEPRGLIDITRQRADYRAAIDLARRLDGIDHERIALWGTSFGGGHVLATAARYHGIAAAIIQNPFVDGHAAAGAAIRSSGRIHAYRLAWRAVRGRYTCAAAAKHDASSWPGHPVHWR